MEAPNDKGTTLVKISNAIVALHREYYGRGATRARTIMQDDYVVCFLEDIYTKAERTLIDAGRFQEVQRARHAFQDTMEQKFSAAVEEHTGRNVVGFLSQVRANPDLSVEAFQLAPNGRPGVTSDTAPG
jgi:uncharacterized protein YbcI